MVLSQISSFVSAKYVWQTDWRYLRLIVIDYWKSLWGSMRM